MTGLLTRIEQERDRQEEIRRAIGRPPAARVIEVIEVEFRRGAGVGDDPVRVVFGYYGLDGAYLAERDTLEQRS